MAGIDFDALDDAINSAPSAGFGPRAQFGKLTMEVNKLWWTGQKPNRKLNTQPYKSGVVDKSKGEYLQFVFHVDVQEMNPVMTKEWKRSIDLRVSDKSSKEQSKWRLTDWSEIVEPSLKKVFGAQWHKIVAKGVYAELEEVETVETDKEGNLKGWDAKEPDESGNFTHYTNTVPRFVRSFKSKAECQAAYSERYTKRNTDDMAFGPNGDGEAIPAKVINDAKGLLAAFSNATEALELLATNAPFNEYDLETLLTACEREDLIST